MTDYGAPVWDEGMMLSPQHFQQLRRWVASEVREVGAAISSRSWGFRAWELEEEALVGGEIAIRRCAGLFPYGATFSCPDRDPVPAPRSALDWLGADADEVTVHLAQPLAVAGASAFGDHADHGPWRRQRIEVSDDGAPQSRRELDVARSNLSLRFDGETLDGFRTMPVARVRRREGGGVELVPTFCPPALRLRAAPLATKVLRQVVGALAQKWDGLAAQRRDGSGSAELSGLVMLSAVGDALITLRHHLENGDCAPEAAHLELQRAAAKLCTFQGRIRVNDLPRYDHADPGPGFAAISAALRDLLGDAAPTRCVQVPLVRDGETLFAARFDSRDILDTCRLLFAVKAAVDEGQVSSQFAAKTKVTSSDRIHELLMRAVAGLPVRVLQQPPASVPVRPGRTYFLLENSGEHWDAITATLTLAVHVAPEFPELELELLAIRD